ncbi:hypothetical protein BN6_73930 [Saccharothrix espanaensis DSM 44229]|uniref:Uncharacterized protein n=1 Tax=Saccharothrix espanaensis (strain ATCC 51144 / DSM 44229 / JCM 9112 / NBRC 15066 / NRRL 15764) TaxID=1179773 RepID=K0KDM8_SACES|nr:hypothetical protein BN6_73930 [Saccharothrix espanaensis DSM 44229]
MSPRQVVYQSTREHARKPHLHETHWLTSISLSPMWTRLPRSPLGCEGNRFGETLRSTRPGLGAPGYAVSKFALCRGDDKPPTLSMTKRLVTL